MKKNILITGVSGYVGAMLVDQLLKNPEVGMVVGIDKNPLDELVMDDVNKKLREDKFIFIQKNLSDKAWMGEAKKFNFDIVIHTAWQIREIYGKKNLQWEWNVGGSDNVFDFVFSNKIKKLVHFSSVASYGAKEENTTDHYFIESEEFRSAGYLYADEKKEAEEHLHEKFLSAKKKGYAGQVVVIRPASISGPRGRYGSFRFGLQSALAGGAKKQKNIIYKIVGMMTQFTPVTKNWLRQFVHEDDIVNVTIKSALENNATDYEVFNVCPPGPSMFGSDMAAAVGKKALVLHPQIIRFVFFCMWHVSHGKIPTATGSWRGYSYPIAVDGSKVTKVLNYEYIMNCKDAFIIDEGRYAKRYIK